MFDIVPHIMLETVAGLLGVIAFILIYPLWIKNKKPFFMGLTLWTGVLSCFTFFHVISNIITGLGFTSLPEGWIAFTYLPERILDSTILYFTVYSSHLKQRFTPLILSFCLLLMATFMWYNPVLHHETAFIGRPQEMFQILPAAFVLGSFIDVIKPVTRRLSLVVLSTLIGGLLMGLSHHLYDVWFTFAHLFKISSYAIMLYTVIWIRRTITHFSVGDKDIYGS